ncbi:hypothetical protein ALO79_200374 [Pseudomonas syringae pv. castaneae]|uniref:Acyl-homoserine lactone acylase subunit beta n=1 Tax=Pseudomonas syringae pv. castaneae TaxID=264450 RepID=A0A0P9RXQ1_PSESX|nr:hypothetical protein ALO79_200374 [Pseudomonas syringae pv. castaneae]
MDNIGSIKHAGMHSQLLNFMRLLCGHQHIYNHPLPHDAIGFIYISTRSKLNEFYIREISPRHHFCRSVQQLTELV